MSLRIGIDVGSTHTDAVIVDKDNRLIAATKVVTSPDVTSGVLEALTKIVKESGVDPSEVAAAMFGTTHCLNAILQRKDLARVAVIRIGLPATAAVEPMVDWPPDLRRAVGDLKFLVEGGHEYTGEEISPLNEARRREICREGKGKVEAVAITSVFSPVNPDHEVRAAEIVREELGEIPVTMSSEISTLGLLERENSAILNAAVTFVANRAIQAFLEAMKSLGLEKAKLYLTQNDGTVMEAKHAAKYPIFTVATGATNSLRGAQMLTGIKDAIVVDVGGCTTNVGMLVKGFPRESTIHVEIGGVRTNFRMPDIFSIGIAGGSIVRVDDGRVCVGPESVGHELVKCGLAWGGNVVTATDVALALGVMSIEDPNCKPELARRQLDPELARKAYEIIVEGVEYAIDRVKTRPEPMPVILVGGGSLMLPTRLRGASKVIRPEHAQSANAIGAATAKTGAQIDKAYSLEHLSREKALEDAKISAVAKAVEAGADPNTVEIVEIEEIAMPYLPGNAVRIRVKAVGEIKL
ncbi:hydantoinase/oxoprolinase family protein [Candidatus Bathyarchaeota archaeon]|nr:MAG: hydantoinase/oxoprolinase family protein [Candidatus Bathyarchaeota archaeon]